MSGKRKTRHWEPPRYRPEVEQLGERIVPAIVTVTFNLNEIWVICDNGNDNVYFHESYGGLILLNGQEIKDAQGTSATVMNTNRINVQSKGGHDMITLLLGTYTGESDLDAGAGRDTVYGGPGNDTIVGDDGEDSLIGNAGDDNIWGGQGNDYLGGGMDNDLLVGGTEHDSLVGGAGDDALQGNAGVDSLYGDGGEDILEGGADDDILFGGDDSDGLIGGGGSDFLAGDGGVDVMEGGIGEQDFFSLADALAEYVDYNPGFPDFDLRV